MATLFTQIIEGKIPAHFIAEDERHIAFLDRHPIAEGHTLVVPKKEIADFFAMEKKELEELMHFARRVAERLQGAIPCKRIGLLVLGFEVPHVHIHLVPLQHATQIDAGLPRIESTPRELQEIAQKIRGLHHRGAQESPEPC